MIKYCIAILIGLILLTSCIPPPIQMRPDKFRPVLDQIPAEWDEEPIVILADTTDFTFLPGRNKNRVRVRYCTWYRVNKRIPDLLETIRTSDHESIETVPTIRAAAFYPNGTISHIRQSDIVRFPIVEDGYFSSNTNVQLFSFPRYVEGMVIRIEITRLYHRPEYVHSDYLRSGYHCWDRVIRLISPSDVSLRYSFDNGENIPADTSIIFSESEKTFIIRARKLPKMESQNALKNPELWYAGLHFSLPPEGNRSLSWSALADYYIDLITPSFDSSEAINKMIAEIPDSLDNDKRVDYAFTLLQNRLRYHAELDKHHAYIPRKASKVVTLGYGDCKEMATLMTVILSQKTKNVGIALVSTLGEDQALDSIPTLGVFNHAIVYYKRPDKSLRFFDPTHKFSGPQNSYYDLIGQKALILEEGKSHLVEIPKDSSYDNTIITDSKVFKCQKYKTWRLNGHITLKGHAAFLVYPYLDQMHREESNLFLSQFLKEMFRIRADRASIVSSRSDSIVVTYDASFDHQYIDLGEGGFVLNSPSVKGGNIRYTTLEHEGPRIYRAFRQRDRWTLPTHFTLPDTHFIDNSIAKGSWKIKDNVVIRTFISKTITIPNGVNKDRQEFFEQKITYDKSVVWKR